jgi:hypothetical protein
MKKKKTYLAQTTRIWAHYLSISLGVPPLHPDEVSSSSCDMVIVVVVVVL